MSSKIAAAAKEVGAAYGPALTKAISSGDLGPLKALFVSEQSVFIVLQDAEGIEMEFTLGDVAENNPDTDITWSELLQGLSGDLKAQDYQKTESECVGILGDRFILHTGRLNNSGKLYTENFSLITLNNESGKIEAFESFTDFQTPGTMEDVSEALANNS